jgi:hypothetical protein
VKALVSEKADFVHPACKNQPALGSPTGNPGQGLHPASGNEVPDFVHDASFSAFEAAKAGAFFRRRARRLKLAEGGFTEESSSRTSHCR